MVYPVFWCSAEQASRLGGTHVHPLAIVDHVNVNHKLGSGRIGLHHRRRTSCGIGNLASCPILAEWPLTPKRPDVHERGPPETSPASHPRPQQQAPRPGNPRTTSEPHHQRSDEKRQVRCIPQQQITLP